MQRIIITGGAGLVGQNLVVELERRAVGALVSIDRHVANNSIMRRLHPQATVIDADLSEPGAWQSSFRGADAIVSLQAQISGLGAEAFDRNTLRSTARVLEAALQYQVPYLLHVSSSVVNSRANDFYSRSKRAQERMIAGSGIRHCILRPTLMFGWFDRKHLGWLARLMRRSPVFPIPGHGQYLRQPLFELDFCRIVATCLEQRREGTFDISGLERVPYIELVRQIRRITGARTLLLPVPYGLFSWLLKTYALFDRNPPFTAQQLAALVIPELFDSVDWPQEFGVAPTPLAVALERTFRERPYCDVVLERG